MKSHLKNEAPKPSSIIYATLEHAISGNIFLKKWKDILHTTKKNAKFHVSLTKYG